MLEVCETHSVHTVLPIYYHQAIIKQGLRESPTQVNSCQTRPATYIHTTLLMLFMKPITSNTSKTKRCRKWVSDTDMILDVSEQEHIRVGSNMFNSLLTILTRCHHNNQEIVYANRQKLCYKQSHSSSYS